MIISIATHHHANHQQSLFDCREVKIGTGAQCNLIPGSDKGIAEVHCSISVQPDGKIEITNFDHSIVLNHGARVHRGTSVVADLPTSFSIGDTQFQVSDLNAAFTHDHALCSLTTGEPTEKTKLELRCIDKVAPGPATLTAWLETVGNLQNSVAGSKAFFKDAARTIYNPGGMDGCIILQPHATNSATDGTQWRITASHIPYPNCNISFRPDLVQKATQQRSTLFHDSAQLTSNPDAKDTHTAIVCPVIGSDANVIAVVYGFRTQHSTNNRIGARALEVQFVQLIAKSIASAMKRLEKEAEASRSRILLEQAFSPKLVRQLEVNPQILHGVSRDVTVLFADLRDFSSISEKAGPKLTYRMLTDVMDRFSQIITQNDGVIIDFYGDGISAFWNAPIEQPNHTLMAVKAAHELLATLPELNSLWGQTISHRLRAGVGVHCGEAQVGNAGSSTRLKYGPQGNTVNIASRLESATKEIGIPIIVSEQVAERVSRQYYARRICKTRLKGMQRPTNVCELIEKPLPQSELDLLSKYDEALHLFEQQKFADAISTLCELNLEMPDPATEYLLRQAMQENTHEIDRRQPLPNRSVLTAVTNAESSQPQRSLSE